MSIKIQDQLRGAVTGRSIEQIYDDGIRLDYDKYMDINTYLGQRAYGTEGLVNNSMITAASVAADGTGSSTLWKDKTPEQILRDIDDAILAAWTASGYDNSAIPNHILVDPENFAYLNRTVFAANGATAPVSLLNYLLDNNIAKAKGVDLFIGECKFCVGAGVGSTNRIQSHGSPLWQIPPRPVLEPAIEANKKPIVNQLKKGYEAALNDNMQEAENCLHKAGMIGENAAKGWFENPANKWPPNSPKTIAKKGSDSPLIDTGEMRKAITHVIREE